VADALARSDEREPDKGKFLADCLGLGKQYHLQGRIRSTESVSKVLFETALRIARNRGLLDGEDLTVRRQAFAAEIRHAIRRVDAIEALAASRRAGLLD
jgi:glycerol-3-phosphate O-acyltransferase